MSFASFGQDSQRNEAWETMSLGNLEPLGNRIPPPPELGGALYGHDANEEWDDDDVDVDEEEANEDDEDDDE